MSRVVTHVTAGGYTPAMIAAVRQIVTVEAGGIVRVQSPELREGTTAEVVVLTQVITTASDAATPDGIVDPSWLSFIGMGADSGRTVEQIDADLRELRDEWDR